MPDSSNQQKALAKLAVKVMSDRQLMLILTDKVYELMNEELHQQKERLKNY